MSETESQIPALKRCGRKDGKGNRCPRWFSIDDKRKNCERCRTRENRNKKTEKGKVSHRRANLSEKSRKSKKRYRDGPKGKAAQYRASHSEKGKATRKRRNAMLINKLSASLCAMLSGWHNNPVSFPKLGIFVDNADVRKHFQSTFAPWMTFSNHGKRFKDTLPNEVWHIGHRIPRVWYRHQDVDEIKKAWSRANLFAQCAVENQLAVDNNILSRDQWMALKPIWPKQCDGMTDEQAWVWARDNVDNATRRTERATSNAGSSNLNATVDNDSDSDSESEDWF